MLDFLKIDLKEYRKIIQILIPSFFFIIYLSWKFDIKYFISNDMDIVDGILLLIVCLYLGILLQVMYLVLDHLWPAKFRIFKSSATTSDIASESLIFSFYSTSCLVFLTIFLIEIFEIFINKIDEIIGSINITDIIILVKPYSIIGISLLMFILLKILANFHGENNESSRKDR